MWKKLWNLRRNALGVLGLKVMEDFCWLMLCPEKRLKVFQGISQSGTAFHGRLEENEAIVGKEKERERGRGGPFRESLRPLHICERSRWFRAHERDSEKNDKKIRVQGITLPKSSTGYEFLGRGSIAKDRKNRQWRSIGAGDKSNAQKIPFYEELLTESSN